MKDVTVKVLTECNNLLTQKRDELLEDKAQAELTREENKTQIKA
jgi:hypothetical protein